MVQHVDQAAAAEMTSRLTELLVGESIVLSGVACMGVKPWVVYMPIVPTMPLLAAQHTLWESLVAVSESPWPKYSAGQ
jgi:hypothetical protein